MHKKLVSKFDLKTIKSVGDIKRPGVYAGMRQEMKLLLLKPKMKKNGQITLNVKNVTINVSPGREWRPLSTSVLITSSFYKEMYILYFVLLKIHKL